MRIGIGIDTGGTYTDAVMYDFHAERILCSVKALTTKDDLSIGIGNALDRLPSDLLGKAELIALSTTLATNACVENKGGRAKLLFVGIDRKVVEWVGGDYGLSNIDDIFFLDGRKTDWDSFLTDSREWIRDACAVGVVELDAMDNNAVLENRARDLIAQEYDLPVVCGHELFSDLNSIKRGSSILLNVRLVPLITEFLHATKTALKKRGVNAPVVIVRSDGSMMSEAFAVHRPVETLLCGPAASAIGGLALAKEKDCLIIDMGGTTTDIAIIKDGVPSKAKEGISIGQWSTFVRGPFVDTFGLGGDSAVRFDFNGKLSIQPTRLIPLSAAASRWPVVVEKLRRLAATRKKHPLLVHEFFCPVKDISGNPNYTEKEIAFCKALGSGPLILTEAAEALGTDVYNLDVHRLEEEGVVLRAGLTPTDIMHVKGDFVAFDTEAARLGADFVASCIEVAPDVLCDLVYDWVKESLYRNIVRVLLQHRYPSFRRNDPDSRLDTLISDSWRMSKNRAGQDGVPAERVRGTPRTGTPVLPYFLRFGFETPAVLVGIGAPIHLFLPDVAKALNTRCIVPENAGVANALGAVLGNITATAEVVIKPQYSIEGINGYVVFGKARNSHVIDQEEAIAIGRHEAEAAARDEALRRGAVGDITLTSNVITSAPEASNKTKVLLGITVIATAIGRVAL